MRLSNLGLAALRYPVQAARMAEGRLIRVNRYHGDTRGKAYVVAEPDKSRAVGLIMSKIANPGEQIEDLGRVSEALLIAMALAPGEIIPIDGVRHVAEQRFYG